MGCSLLTEMSARDQDDYQDQVHHTNDQTQRMTCSHLGAFIFKLHVTFPPFVYVALIKLDNNICK